MTSGGMAFQYLKGLRRRMGTSFVARTVVTERGVMVLN